MRKSLYALIFASVLVGFGCGKHWKPAPMANVLPGTKDTAFAQVDGVRVAVNPDAWKANPSDLTEVLTPLKTTIENNSTEQLCVAYREFSLVTATGFHYSVIPPYKIEGSIARVTVTPRFAYSGFWLSPYYSSWYGPGFATWRGPWAYDPFYYPSYEVWRQPIPTQDMLELAIPEGVLDAGGKVSGFLYFPKVDPKVKQVTFAGNLVGAKTQIEFGELEIPFVIE